LKQLTLERERRGWSRAELARRAGLNAATVGLAEAGRLVLYPSQVDKLARAMDLTEVAAARLLEEVDREPITA
jgi:ribosome-binding protein aMBF1 (putative translation factor)